MLEGFMLGGSMGVARIFFSGEWHFENFQKTFLRKLRKCIILAYFWKYLTNHALIFCGFGRKTQFIGNFEKTFENIEKNFLRKLQKCIILAYFWKNLTDHALIFCAFGRKTQIVGNFKKIYKSSLKKILKMYYFSIWHFEKTFPSIFHIFLIFAKLNALKDGTIVLQRIFRFHRVRQRLPSLPTLVTYTFGRGSDHMFLVWVKLCWHIISDRYAT